MKTLGRAQTDVGRSRLQNEDCFVVDEALGVYIVCDGVGGRVAGEVASVTAAKTAHGHLRKDREVLRSGDAAEIRRSAVSAVQTACREVHRLSQSRLELAGMSTTLTMVITAGQRAVLGHVGDSQAFLLRGGKLSKLTFDHTLYDDLVRSGEASKEDAAAHPQARALTRVVGVQPHVRVDLFEFDLLTSDTLLLCSDGLTRGMKDRDSLAEYLGLEDPGNVLARLIDLANAQGGQDNITALLVRPVVDQAQAAKARARSTQYHERVAALRSLPLFQDLALGDLLRVLRRFRVDDVRKGQVLVEEGKPGLSYQVVLSGRVSVRRQENELTQLPSGRSFGETFLLQERPAQCSVVALQEGRMMVLDRTAFDDLIRKNPRFGNRLLQRVILSFSKRLDRISLDLHRKDPSKLQEDVEAPIWI